MDKQAKPEAELQPEKFFSQNIILCLDRRYNIRILSSYEEVLLKSLVLEIWTLGSVRDVKQSVGLLKVSTRQTMKYERDEWKSD